MSADRPGELPEGAIPWMHDLGRWIGRRIVPLPFRVRTHGVERVPASGPLVVVANHSSMVDGPLLFGILPRRSLFLVKHELFGGALGWFLRRLGQLPVRRGEVDRTSLLTAVQVLRGGGIVGVFPEGTRGAGDVASAQHGAAWLGRSSGALVLPVACRGTRRPVGSGRRFRPVVDVLIGEPFALPAGRGRQELNTATEKVREQLAALVVELDCLRGDQPASVGQDDDDSVAGGRP